MVNLSMIKATLPKVLGRTGLVVSKYSPEILMGLGIVGVVTSTVLACKATLKVDSIVEKSKDNFAKIHRIKETHPEESYSEEDYKKDLAIVWAQQITSIGRLYAPAIALGAVSIGCLIGSHNILSKRNVALMAAYKLIDEGYSKYRKRVISDLGVEKDQEYRFGPDKEVKKTDEEEKRDKDLARVNDEYGITKKSIYAKFFDEYSTQWRKDPAYSLFFLKSQQNYANDLLNSRGHVFLNEVYDMLGIPRTQEGAIVGWVKDSPDGDGVIDFGIYDGSKSSREFVNGYNQSVLLDFNVDGIIYDLI